MEWINIDPASGSGEVIAPPVPDEFASLSQVREWITIKSFQDMIAQFGVAPTNDRVIILHYVKLCNDYDKRYPAKEVESDGSQT